MESHTIDIVLLILGFSFLYAVVVALQAIVSTGWMALALQEQVAVWDTPVIVQMTFGKCHCK